MCHPGGPGCKTNKNFKQPGYDFDKNCQAEIQITVQVLCTRCLCGSIPIHNLRNGGHACLEFTCVQWHKRVWL